MFKRLHHFVYLFYFLQDRSDSFVYLHVWRRRNAVLLLNCFELFLLQTLFYGVLSLGSQVAYFFCDKAANANVDLGAWLSQQFLYKFNAFEYFLSFFQNVLNYFLLNIGNVRLGCWLALLNLHNVSWVSLILKNVFLLLFIGGLTNVMDSVGSFTVFFLRYFPLNPSLWILLCYQNVVNALLMAAWISVRVIML